MPLFEQGKIVLLSYCRRTLYDGTTTDLVQDFIEQEFTAFPVSQHDDMLDALSRICDEKELGLHWPQTDLQRAQRQADRPSSYTGGGNATSMWQRHKAKISGRGTGQRPGPRPQESGVWAKGTGWK
jgi:hypothetical protein